MPGPDMLIGVNMAKIAGNARMAEAQDYIDEVCAERNRAILENRRLAAKLREMEDRLEERRFKQSLEALRTVELAQELRKRDPNCSVIDPSRALERRQQKAQALLSDPSYDFQGYVYDAATDSLRRG